MGTLRERNRQRTMDHVIEAALDLFEERGYAHVKISDIAAAAEVSESTFYRLFRTKEGIFTAAPAEPPVELQSDDIGGAAVELREILTRHSWRGFRWVVTEPGVRSAVLTSLDSSAELLAGHLVSHGVEPLLAQIQARTLFFGIYLSALDAWYAAGAQADFADVYDAALAAARWP